MAIRAISIWNANNGWTRIDPGNFYQFLPSLEIPPQPAQQPAGRGKAPARPASGSTSTLVTRNVRIGGRRTSLRLEPALWDALDEVCQREGLTRHQLCTRIDERKRLPCSICGA